MAKGFVYFLVILALVFVYKSFLMDKDLFKATPRGDGALHHAETTFLTHRGSGVCLLGKIGAWVILFWSVLMLVVLMRGWCSRRRLAMIDIVVLTTVFTLCLLLNRPLLARSMPFFACHVLVVLFLVG
jgi:hypothetical protein